jgi:RES domain-containing protein
MAAVVGTTWDATVAVAACPRGSWSGTVWRVHSRRFAGDSAEGSLRISGRFHRGPDKFAAHETWPALYTSVAPAIALAERMRHTTPANLIQKMTDQRMTRLRIELQVVVSACAESGCRTLEVQGLSEEALCHPTDWQKAQELALAARDCAEALLVPSCTRLPEGNLIIFPDRLLAGSEIRIEHFEDPELIAG